jgi:hypothetical protein
MNPSNIIVRFDTVAEQVASPVLRIIGFARARDLLNLFDAADLEANPRSAKSGSVTEDILESIEDEPHLFAFKTKGILVAASNFEKLQRNRYRLMFENGRIEGILDGGHNALAIGTHVLVHAVGTSIKKKIRGWADFKELWERHREDVNILKAIKEGDDGYDKAALDFMVPIEILVPSDLDDENIMNEFNSSLLQICSARNNNVQLTQETKSNKKGFFEDLRTALPAEIADRVEWKTNDGGEIKVRDLIALAWIPLSVVDDPIVPAVLPQNIYRNKGECAKLYDQLLKEPAVSHETDGEYTRALHHKAILSAIRLSAELPELYDKIYMDFPFAYNENGGKFGKLKIVKMAGGNSQPTSYFTDRAVQYSYPDGLMMPLVYGLRALMTQKADGTVTWVTDPVEFLDKHLTTIVGTYTLMLDAYNFDPQKVGKANGAYRWVMDAYATELLKHGKSATVKQLKLA